MVIQPPSNSPKFIEIIQAMFLNARRCSIARVWEAWLWVVQSPHEHTAAEGLCSLSAQEQGTEGSGTRIPKKEGGLNSTPSAQDEFPSTNT